MLFSTLLLQIILEYVDRLSGFSHLFGDVRIENMKMRLKDLKDRKRSKLGTAVIAIISEPLDEKQSESESSVSVPGSAMEVSLREKFMRLFRWRGKAANITEVRICRELRLCGCAVVRLLSLSAVATAKISSKRRFTANIVALSFLTPPLRRV